MRARIGEWRVGAAAAGEFGIQLDDVADIDDDQEGRPALLRRQGPRIVLGLGAGAQQGVVEDLANRFGQIGLLGFEDVAGAPIAVDEAVGTRSIAVGEYDAPLEDVGVVARVGLRRMRLGEFQKFAQLGDEELIVGAFATAGRLLAGDEGVDGVRGCHGAKRCYRKAQDSSCIFGNPGHDYSTRSDSSRGRVASKGAFSKKTTARSPTKDFS